jgi:hypothetical protein
MRYVGQSLEIFQLRNITVEAKSVLESIFLISRIEINGSNASFAVL